MEKEPAGMPAVTVENGPYGEWDRISTRWVCDKLGLARCSGLGPGFVSVASFTLRDSGLAGAGLPRYWLCWGFILL